MSESRNSKEAAGPNQLANFLGPETEVTKELRAKINELAEELSKTTTRAAQSIAQDIEYGFLDGVVKNLAEAKEMVLNGPLVKGFAETQDPQIPDRVVKDFLKETFGEDISQKALLGLVSKDDKFLVYRGDEQKNIALFNELTEAGILKFLHGQFTARYADTKEDYIVAALKLEGQTDPKKLQHKYKVRATAGSPKMMAKIQLHSFAIEQVSDYNYLNNLALSEQHKMRAYILGTLSHEVAHRVQRNMENNLFKMFEQIVEEETDPKEGKYVSAYTKKHLEIYKSPAEIITREDFVETIRIYTTNPEFLKTYYPKRFDFVLKYYPFVKAGGVIEAIKNIN